MRKVLFVSTMTVILGLLVVAQDATSNQSAETGAKHATLNETGPLARFLHKATVGTKSNAQANSIQQSAAIHVFKFVTVDFPGASFTQVAAVNNGVVVGNYSFGSTTNLVPFTFKGGVYRTLTVPGAVSARVFSVNSAGQIVGSYFDSAGVRHGFLDSVGVFTNIDFPGSVDTTVTDINTAGDMVGVWGDESSSGGGGGEGRQHGFILQGGVFTSLDFPGASLTAAFGINDSDEVIGSFENAGVNNTGFIYQAGVFTPLTAPLAVSTNPFGVDNAGDISGSYQDASGTDHGFLFSDGAFSNVDVTGAAATALTHIPNKGPFAVNFTDQSGEGHGATGQ